MHIKVAIDASKPLIPSLLNHNGAVKKILKVKYEDMGVFCYFCGKLGHDNKKCFDLMKARGKGEDVLGIKEQNSFGHSLRGDPGHLKSIVKWTFKNGRKKLEEGLSSASCMPKPSKT